MTKKVTLLSYAMVVARVRPVQYVAFIEQQPTVDCTTARVMAIAELLRQRGAK